LIFDLAYNTQMKANVIARIFLIIILSASFAGCGGVSESKIKKILAKDPSFEEDLNKKKQIASKIAALKVSYRKETREASGKIRALKANLKSKKNNLNTAILSLGAEIRPNIRSLREALKKKRSEYDKKHKEFKDSLAKAENIRKLLEKKKDLSLSSDEVVVWNKRSRKLEEKIVALRKTLDDLRAKTRLLKIEIQILEK